MEEYYKKKLEEAYAENSKLKLRIAELEARLTSINSHSTHSQCSCKAGKSTTESCNKSASSSERSGSSSSRSGASSDAYSKHIQDAVEHGSAIVRGLFDAIEDSFKNTK